MERPSETLKKREAYDWGKQGEEIAADYLLKKGYTIRERRFRLGAGKAEIDIIAELPGTMVFVEVKTRTLPPSPIADSDTYGESSDPDAPAEAVDLRKMRLMTRLADRYLAMQNADYEYRFDIICLTGTPASHTLSHIPDAFLAPLGR